MKKIFAGEFDFYSMFVKTQSNIVLELEAIKNRKMPVLLQSFNRYSLYYEEKIQEYPTIFDALGTLLCIMIKDFSKEMITFAISRVLEKQEKEMEFTSKESKKKNQKEQQQQQQAATVENFSTLQTTLIDDPMIDETSGLF